MWPYKISPPRRAALEALITNEVQMATGADLAFSILARDDPSLRIVASIATTDSTEVVARKDRGIASPADLRGKSIGVSLNTVGHYYLTKFLMMNAIPLSEVTVVNLNPDTISAALADGTVDAIAAWDSSSYPAVRQLGGGTAVWSAQNTQDYFWVLAVKQGFADSLEVRRMLAALKEAEDFALLHNGEARAIVTRRLGFDEEFMGRYWAKTRLSLTLDQSLILNLEEAEAWKPGQDQGRDPGAPNKLADVSNSVDTRAMDEIDPKAVTIFR